MSNKIIVEQIPAVYGKDTYQVIILNEGSETDGNIVATITVHNFLDATKKQQLEKWISKVSEDCTPLKRASDPCLVFLSHPLCNTHKKVKF